MGMLRCCLFAGLLMMAGPVAGDNPETAETLRLRDVDRLVFEGVKAFDVDTVREELAGDVNVLIAANPRSAEREFLDQVQSIVRAGYQHAGFRDATVEVRPDEKRQAIVVQVAEGQRSVCGDVEVVGVQKVAPDALVKAVGEAEASGREFWKAGAAVHFDDHSAVMVRKKILAAFAAAGYLSPEFDVAVITPAEGNVAKLKITVKDEGPRAVVNIILVQVTDRDTVGDVLKYLELQRGMPYDSGLIARIEQRLRDSGRYVHWRVSRVGEDSLPSNRVNLQIELSEYPAAPALTSDLPPAAVGLFKFGAWLDQWTKGQTDDDLIIEYRQQADSDAALFANEGKAAAFDKSVLSTRLILAPNRGMTFDLRLAQADGTPILHELFLSSGERFTFGAVHRQARLDMPRIVGQQFVFNVQGITKKPIGNEKADGKNFTFNFGMGFRPTPKEDFNPFKLNMTLPPALLLYVLNIGELKGALVEGTWHLQREAGMRIRIDGATGRLLEMVMGDPKQTIKPVFQMRVEKNAVKQEMARMDELLQGAVLRYDGNSPWKSLAEFALDEWLHIDSLMGSSPETLRPTRALRKLTGLWTPPAFGELLGLDRHELTDAERERVFRIPTRQSGFDLSAILGPGSDSRKNLAAAGFPIYRRLVPKSAWPLIVGREATLYFSTNDQIPHEALIDAVYAPNIGPVAELLLATLAPRVNLHLSQSCAERGLQRLSVDDFRKDYRPFLEDGKSWLSRWLLTLGDALRTLDESELRDLANLFPETAPRDAIAAFLVRIKGTAGESATDAFAAALDQFWTDKLSRLVEERLTSIALPAVRSAPQPLSK